MTHQEKNNLINEFVGGVELMNEEMLQNALQHYYEYKKIEEKRKENQKQWEAKNKAPTKAGQEPKKTKQTFRRSYDMDELERQLLRA